VLTPRADKAQQYAIMKQSILMQSGELPGRMSFVAVGDGPPLVVFPGLSRVSAGSSSEAQMQEGRHYRALARVTGRTVYVFHRPAGIAAGTTMAELAATHAAALEAHFGAPVDVMGASTGGAIALQLAVDHPAVPRKLVVAAAASWLGDAGRRRLRLYSDRIAQGKSGAAVLASVLAGPLMRWPATALIWLMERRERHVDPADMLATIDAECGFDVTSQLGQITAPTLVIAGARDRAFTPQLFEATAAGIPNSQLVLYPNRGHIGTMLDPRFGRDVAAFLNR
jgi:pimeloyl-ACP methyl ester carboxylesterase